jgi:hypothetical protein
MKLLLSNTAMIVLLYILLSIFNLLNSKENGVFLKHASLFCSAFSNIYYNCRLLLGPVLQLFLTFLGNKLTSFSLAGTYNLVYYYWKRQGAPKEAPLKRAATKA